MIQHEEKYRGYPLTVQPDSINSFSYEWKAKWFEYKDGLFHSVQDAMRAGRAQIDRYERHLADAERAKQQ